MKIRSEAEEKKSRKMEQEREDNEEQKKRQEMIKKREALLDDLVLSIFTHQKAAGRVSATDLGKGIVPEKTEDLVSQGAHPTRRNYSYVPTAPTQAFVAPQPLSATPQPMDISDLSPEELARVKRKAGGWKDTFIVERSLQEAMSGLFVF